MVDILMAVYNGEKYIACQIDSIVSQTYENWRLIIQDDCSVDKTVDIIKKYVKNYPDKIFLYINEKPTGSAKSNFFSMLKYVENDYIMFCDQDDFWVVNKIELTVNEAKRQEMKNKCIPLLIHTDLKIVDVNLNLLKKSFFKYQGLDNKAVALNRLLVQNNITGCTMLINKKLLSIIKDNTEHALMHDWWIGLIASCFGKICFIDEATVLYRQHGKNQLGAVNNRNIKSVVKILFNCKKTKERLFITFTQAQSFLAEYIEELTIQDKIIIKKYINVLSCTKIKRIYTIIKNRFLKQNLLAVIAQLLFC